MTRIGALAFAVVIALADSGSAWADCSLVPSGSRPNGAIIKNTDLGVLQYCDNTTWRLLTYPSGGGIGGTCPFEPGVWAGHTLIYSICGDANYIYTISYNGDEMNAWSFDGDWTELASTVADYVDTTGNMWCGGGWIYETAGPNGVRAYSFDGTSFSTPVVFDTAGQATRVWSDGTYIFVADGTNGILALTFNGTAWAPATGNITTSRYNTPGEAFDVWGDGTYVYVADVDEGVRALTFNGSAWTSVGTPWTDNTGEVLRLRGDGTYIYAADDSDLRALSFNGSAFTLEGTYAGVVEDGAVYVNNGLIYVNNGHNTLALSFDGDSFAVDGLLQVAANDLWSDGTHLYAAQVEGPAAFSSLCGSP